MKPQGCTYIGATLVALTLIVTGRAWGLGLPPSSPDESYQPPSASAGTDQAVLVGEVVWFPGYGSSIDDEIVEYAWDFDSDGIPDFVSMQTGCTTHRFSESGEYECVLTVTDSLGKTATDSMSVIVVAQQADLKAVERIVRPQKAPMNKSPDGVRRRYAVILNGGYDERYWRDVELAYDMLTAEYGFASGDIYLLNYDGKNPSGANPNGMIDYPARVEYIESVFNQLSVRVDGDDEVSIWIIGHGYGYSGPLSEGGQYLGYNSGRISVDPGDEPDFPESDFKLRSLFTGGDYRCNHGMNEWKVRKKYAAARGTEYYRNKFVSTLDELYIEELGEPVSDDDIYIERLVDYLLGDTNLDGYIDTSSGEVIDFDGDGQQPYNNVTGTFDEDDWGAIDKLEDNYNNAPCTLPEGSYPYKLFDEGLAGKICIDLGYAGGTPEVDGRDEDGEGLFDWMDVNRDGDTNDIISIDESIYLAAGVIYDDELAELVNQLSAARITLAALPCFSGGLIEDLAAPGRVICTATIEEAVSWGDVFIRGFVAALAGRNEYGSPVNADTNANGHISFLEAFNYAAINDHYDEIPQYDDNGDGISHTDPVPAEADGTLGCCTYLTGFLPWNLTGDGTVDFLDFAQFAAHWLQSECARCGGADFTCDEKVDFSDMLELSANWLTNAEQN